ncbi:11-cis retinol dehydrogenase [Nitrospira tepida]|uniref:11-cis retinol dehydrogenase n=1 Tax=Nitrospira tepida TaxID=2973512 RepID=A0AA86T7N7_9BACT|nr:SDR family oxidoreductase [Nitrospira tepida]CAI4033211.1 11-cis retinol dehydrogenase [Nitrospira tepida]
MGVETGTGAAASTGRAGIVITGASSGIGEACAMHLDRQGFRVFAGVRAERDRAALRAKASSRLTPLRLDVTDLDSIATAVRTVSEAVGEAGLAGLVNNAGIAVPGPIETVPLDLVRRQFEVNVVGQIAVIQAFLPLLRKGRGRIVNMSSIAGVAAVPFLGIYGASKFALEAMTDALRLELRAWGISVSLVEPGAIATRIWNKSACLAESIRASADPALVALYEPLMRGLARRATDAERRALSPNAVALAVVHALTAARPRLRYLVGTDAKVRAAAKRFFGDRAHDRLVAAILRLPKSGQWVAGTGDRKVKV